jgi:glycosyltransferase involved in cell wall biosynthesis
MVKKRENKISVIIPCYNDGKFILDAIKSVEKCKDVVYEIIVVDDGSKDHITLRILNQIKKKGHKVIPIKHKGQSKARNIGVKFSKYPYVLFLDSDNRIFPEYITVGMEILKKNPKIGIVYGDRKEFGLNNRVIVQKDFDISEEIFENNIDTCAIIRKKVFEDCNGFDENFFCMEDWEFFINAYKHGWKFYHIPKVMFEYRIKDKSVNTQWHDKKKRKKILNLLYKKHYDVLVDEIDKAIYYGSLKNKLGFYRNSINPLIFENESLKIKIYSIERSLTWKINQVLENFINIIIPKGSPFRRFYDYLILKNQNIINKDFKVLNKSKK